MNHEKLHSVCRGKPFHRLPNPTRASARQVSQKAQLDVFLLFNFCFGIRNFFFFYFLHSLFDVVGWTPPKVSFEIHSFCTRLFWIYRHSFLQECFFVVKNAKPNKVFGHGRKFMIQLVGCAIVHMTGSHSLRPITFKFASEPEFKTTKTLSMRFSKSMMCNTFFLFKRCDSSFGLAIWSRRAVKMTNANTIQPWIELKRYKLCAVVTNYLIYIF